VIACKKERTHSVVALEVNVVDRVVSDDGGKEPNSSVQTIEVDGGLT
jgi:hypothetical protein